MRPLIINRFIVIRIVDARKYLCFELNYVETIADVVKMPVAKISSKWPATFPFECLYKYIYTGVNRKKVLCVRTCWYINKRDHSINHVIYAFVTQEDVCVLNLVSLKVVAWAQWASSVQSSTQCGLVRPNDDKDFGQHCLRNGSVPNGTHPLPEPMWPCGIRLPAISQKILKIFVFDMNLEFTNLSRIFQG